MNGHGGLGTDRRRANMAFSTEEARAGSRGSSLDVIFFAGRHPAGLQAGLQT